MHTTTRIAALFLSGVLMAALPAGCSDKGCDGQAYHPDLGQDGAKTPIQSLETWLGVHQGLPEPPVENWIVQDSGDPTAAEVTITNDDGNGWWVIAERTSSGGWVVSQATDDAAGCGDDLS